MTSAESVLSQLKKIDNWYMNNLESKTTKEEKWALECEKLDKKQLILVESGIIKFPLWEVWKIRSV